MKQYLIISFLLFLGLNGFGQDKITIIKTDSKKIHNRIKSDGMLIVKDYSIYFSQNPVLKYCDSIITNNKSRYKQYLELKDYLLNVTGNAKLSWVKEISEKYDIKIRDLKNDIWADKIEIEHFSDGNTSLVAYFGQEKINLYQLLQQELK